MSFGSKQYQHRFYTTPKVRDRHISDFMMAPELNHQRYGSVSAFNPYPNSPILENSMKQSYLRLIQNGMTSRFYTKDQLGYEGLKFQKDVISRYCGDDYRKNSQILQKFKRQAEESKRSNKYRHLRENQNQRDLLRQEQIFPTRKIQTPSFTKQKISFLPITNSGVDNLTSSPENLLSIKNTQNLVFSQEQKPNNVRRTQHYTQGSSRLLPALKLQKYLNSNLNEVTSGVIYEQESHNQNQDQRIYQDKNDNSQIKHSIVRDVGVNAHLITLQREQNNHKKRQSQSFIKNHSKISHDRKKSESLRIETMKLKNNHMKKKYEKLKRQMMEKSFLLSHHQQMEKQRHELEKQQKNKQHFQNLSLMIHSLCDKLRQNNSKIQLTKSKYCERQNQDSSRVTETEKIEPLKEEDKEKEEKGSNNSTQINLLKSSRIQELLKRQQMQNNTEKYTKELEKIESYRNNKPKIIYSLNKSEKYVKNDALKLLKNRIKEKHLHGETLADYSRPKNRSKTQGY